jgi:type IV secretion system protein TrbL
MKGLRRPGCCSLAVAALLYSANAAAALDTGVFDDVLGKYQAAAKTWAGTILGHASTLFWTLVTISMVWTFGMMALRKADLGEFFAEFVRFTIFTGFFWWLLTNGPDFADSIIDSMRQMGSEAAGLGTGLNPTGIVDIGFVIFFRAIDSSSIVSPVDSAVGIILSAIILIILGLVAANMLLMLCSAWILMYGGVFFLGFGGSRWTSDMAINYYKTVLGIGASLFAMTLLIGVGTSVLDNYYSQMSQGINFREMGVILIVCIILLYLIDKIPTLISGIITGASLHHAHLGNFGAGAAVGATGMAAMAASMGGSMLAAGAAHIGGGTQAVMAAVRAADRHMATGEGMFRGTGGSGGGLSYSESMGQGVRFAADVGANLMKGTGSVLAEKALDAAQSFRQAASETFPGQVATAINESVAASSETSSAGAHGTESPSFANNSLAPGTAGGNPANPEVVEFMRKGARQS